MIKKIYFFSLFSSLLLLTPLHSIDKTKTKSDRTVSIIGKPFHQVFELFLTAILKEDLETMELCLSQAPTLLEVLFEKNLNIQTTAGIINKTLTINPLIFAIINSKLESIKFLLQQGASLNKKINNLLPLFFISTISPQETRNEVVRFLLNAGAIGNPSTDLHKCVDILEEINNQINIKKNPEKLLTHPSFSQVIEILELNPEVLFTTHTSLINIEQNANIFSTEYHIVNLLKTAILLDSPELTSFFIKVKKKYSPPHHAINQKISNHFNLIDYLTLKPQNNKELFNIILNESPLISDYLIYTSEEVDPVHCEKIHDLYMQQNDEEKAAFLETLKNPCIHKELLPKNYLSINPITMEIEQLTEEITNNISSLFSLIENNDNFEENEKFLNEAKKLISSIKNPKHLNIPQKTTEYNLTCNGHMVSQSYETLLSAAINKQSLALLTLLIEAGTDIHQSITNPNELAPITTLHYAATEESVEIVSYLLKKGAHITPEIQSNMHVFEPEIQECLLQHMQTQSHSHKRQRDEKAENVENALPQKRICSENGIDRIKE